MEYQHVVDHPCATWLRSGIRQVYSILRSLEESGLLLKHEQRSATSSRGCEFEMLADCTVPYRRTFLRCSLTFSSETVQLCEKAERCEQSSGLLSARPPRRNVKQTVSVPLCVDIA